MQRAYVTGDNGRLMWHCPGSKGSHGVPVVGPGAWQWNGSLELPTLVPSVHVLPHKSSPPFVDQPRCHTFIRDGKIQFLSDCEHELAGQTVDMEEWT